MPPQARPRFDPTINLGHLITLAGVIAAVIGGWWVADHRLAALERQVARLSDVIVVQAVTTERVSGLAHRLEQLERR